MLDKNKIVIAQLNPIVGDIKDNARKIIEAYRAAADGTDLIITPADALTGAPLGDLAGNQDFLVEVEREMALLAGKIGKAPIVVSIGGNIYLIQNGKVEMGNDFVLGKTNVRVASNGTNVPIWNPGIYISLDTIPFRIGRAEEREKLARDASKTQDVIWVNRVGAEGEHIFDGGSFAIAKGGEKIFQMPRWIEGVQTVVKQNSLPAQESEISEMYNAAVLGLSDYYVKNGFFKGVLLGMSGGLDSALVFAIAAAAIGAKAVRPVAMPSKYTTGASNSLAEEMCKNYGVELQVEPIEHMVEPFRKTLDPKRSITDENLQARVRGMLLMGISNEEDRLLLSTSNKSEVAVGYGTLYGDMCGGYNPIKDIYKTDAFEMCRHINKQAGREMIPAEIINRAPSAELSAGQKDSDSLPPYPVLDHIIKSLVEDGLPVDKIDADRATVLRVAKMIQNAEFKRSQACIGPSISKRAFADTNMPVLNKFERQR
ncbi:MAG: NAD(+) synthase [Alphaproteobacteria bacterium]|nr:NAD(+) synthase [Alphaproteobacteria bacterium]